MSPHRRVRWRRAKRFLFELERLAAPCDEHAGPVHVTASGLVVGRRGTVLHRHKRLGIWMQPGGHIDAGESPATAARREATEELGLAVEHPAAGPLLVHLDVHDAAFGHTHLDLRYLLLGADDDPHPPPGESPDARAGAAGTRRSPWPMPGSPTRCPSHGPPTRASRDRRARPPAHRAGPRHVHHPATAPARRAGRDDGPRRGGGGAGRARPREGRGRGTARRARRPPRRTSRSRSQASAAAVAPSSGACTQPPARPDATSRP